MKSEWKEVKVKDILYTTDYVANGSFAALKENVTYKDTPDHAILIRLVDFNAGWNGEFKYVDKSSYEFLKKSYVEPQDVIVSNVGANVGTVFQAPKIDKPMTLGPNSILIRPENNDEVERDYIYYYFTSRYGQSKISAIVSGSAQPKFNKTDFRTIDLLLPPFSTQRKIAHILSTLDDKIELNRKMNQTLEEMAQALFKSWFVDFDPVHAKAKCSSDEELETVACELGIAKEVLDLFPSEFEESELGMIPKGWELKTIKDFGKVVTGKTPSKKIEDAYDIKGKPFVTPTDIDDSLFVINTARYLSDIGQKAVKNSMLPGGSICVTCIGSQMGKTTVTPVDSISNQQINSIIPTKGHFRNYLLCNLRGRKKEIFLLGSGGGSTMPLLNKTSFEKVDVLQPSINIIEAFDCIVKDNITLILHNDINNNTLQKIRDTLLPKLLAGELDVSELDLDPE